MQVLDHTSQALEEWRPGVRTRMRVSALTGSVQLCVFEQWCDPGKGAPTHLHAVEEVLSVIEGSAEVWVEAEIVAVMAGQSVVVPAGRKHGFRNTGTDTLHVMATLASPMFEASFDAAGEISRRWLPA
jgi:mannose-6-phosphate isomerase-like protein (cupin superfamily)